MQREICVHEGGLYTVLRVLEDGDVLLLHCAPHPYEEADVAPHALRSAGAGQPGHTAGPDRPRTAWIALWTTWALRTPLTGDPLGALRPALKQFVI